MPFECRYVITRDRSRARLKENFESGVSGRMLHKYFWSVPPLISSVIIINVGSMEAPMNCFK